MFTGQILCGNWDTGIIDIGSMPKDFVLSARKLVVMEEAEYAELAGARKEPEPATRAIICIYCGTYINYEPNDKEKAYEKVKEHDLICTWSPLVRRIKELEAELAKAGKKPEPTEFTKYLRSVIKEHEKLGEIKALQACDEIDRLTAENERLKPFERFYRHIEEHLGPEQRVICKICGKSLREIEQALKEKV